MSVALVPLTDKMDPKYIIQSEAYESHNDAYPKEKCWPSWIFEKMAKNLFFQLFLSIQTT